MNLSGARILVIDDHADLVENLQEILEDDGATVETASSAEAGIELAQDPFDVALVDVQLPDDRGPAVVPRLKTGDGLAEVLLVTGHASVHDAAEAVKAGAFAYILKPFDSEELVATIGRAVERVRLQRKTATLQRRLEGSEEALRTMVDTVQALLLVVDADFRIVQANPAVALATGLPLERIIGEHWLELCVPPRVRRDLEQSMASVREDHAGVSVGSIVLQRLDNGQLAERHVDWRLSGLGEGDNFRVYASGLDVTDLHDLQRRTRLAEKLAAVGTVSAGLAHEIRNPLNAANLQLQLLERRLHKLSEDEALNNPLQTVRQEISRLGNLVTDFLTFARPQALNFAKLDLHALLQQVLGLVGPVASERGVKLELQGEETWVEGDRARLEQVLLNLVRNALDAVAGQPNARVDVRVGRDGAGGRIVVSDNGPGVDPEIAARIFEPFFTTKEMGTGLGMAIAHKIVELHGGEITLEAAEGAAFELTLPPTSPRPV